MHTTVYSGAIVGIEGLVVEVEVDIARGIPAFSVVGLPNAAVREARERVTSAIKNSGCHFPLERITCNLAPADVKKEGSAHDLAIAIGILLASGQAEATTARTIFIGELALDGSLRRVPGVLPILLHARARDFARAVIPFANV
ncbi:MAG TPA: magnesium chelatase domain-containing protein, partial [Candidatus Krumholzibacteria bacterium]|nr:magnesium chelatase domain-containing protein [Candidatus Krumholzibacteria bacterium]